MPCKRINTVIKVFYVICCLIVVIPKFWLKRQCFGVQVPQLFPIITEAPFIKTVLSFNTVPIDAQYSVEKSRTKAISL